MKYVILFILTLSIVLSACAPTPEPPPTSTPKPTWTIRPHGVFKGCLYYEGELIMGTITFFDENDDELPSLTRTGVECIEIILDPGEYFVMGISRKGADCSEGPVPCSLKDGACNPFTIDVDEVIEMELILYQLQ